MAEWIDPPSVEVPDKLTDVVGGDSLVARLLAQRGIWSPEEARRFLDPAYYEPSPSEELPDLQSGKGRIREAIRNEEQILVWGDFDVDGQTSTALLTDALRELGGRVTYHIPHRERESHGVNRENLRSYLDDGVEVVLTCDTGISSHEALRLAAREGAEVVVTDHHDLPAQLPEALALINPKRLPEDHPFRSLPGVGVAYKFIQALARGTGLDPTDYLDLVALGIVADIARLQGDTRYLLQHGLQKLRETSRPGLLAVMENADVTPESADEEDIGYRIGPRLNAVGRLGDASVSVPLLTTDDRGEAKEIVAHLEELNDTRKLLTDQVFETAKRKLRRSPELMQHAVLVLYGERWPEGVIGIVAHRLAEKYHKPAILFTTVSEEDPAAGEGKDGRESPSLARGSARSIEGLDISAAIGEHEEMLSSFGGHPMAAGLTLPKGKISRFRRLVSRSVVEQKGGEELVPTLQIDRYVGLGELSLELAEKIRKLAPFGPGNPEVTLACRDLQVAEAEEIGSNGNHLKVTVMDPGGETREVLFWSATRRDLPTGLFDLAFQVSENIFRGERSLQMTWKDARERRKEAGRQVEEESSLQVIDHRGVGDRASLLRELSERKGAQVWLEARSINAVEGKTRLELSSCEELVLGTVPPSGQVLEAAVETCEPETIHVVGLSPTTTSLEGFVRRLLGLSKHAIRSGKTVSLSRLAAAMGHEKRSVQLGLEWLEQQGQIRAEDTEDGLSLKSGSGNGGTEAPRMLIEALEEARAFRKYVFQGGEAVSMRSAAK